MPGHPWTTLRFIAAQGMIVVSTFAHDPHRAFIGLGIALVGLPILLSLPMNPSEEKRRSRYMEWAKPRSSARFNLASSGLTSVPLASFPLRVEELEITGGGYGYGPLLERIARHTGAPVECRHHHGPMGSLSPSASGDSGDQRAWG